MSYSMNLSFRFLEAEKTREAAKVAENVLKQQFAVIKRELIKPHLPAGVHLNQIIIAEPWTETPAPDGKRYIRVMSHVDLPRSAWRAIRNAFTEDGFAYVEYKELYGMYFTIPK